MEEENPFSKAQTVDPEVRAYVYSLVNALGGSSADENGRYVLGDDALACLRDLKRWLKLYDEKTNRLDVARCLAEAKLVTGDILPILASWPESNKKDDKIKSRVALACLELLVPLTWPLETSGEMTVNHHRHTPYLLQAQVMYKAGILGWDTCSILRQIVRIGLPSIALPRDARTARDEGIIKLVLYFIRNVASIQQMANLPDQGLETEVSRSATIEAFRQQDVFALLLTICSNMGEDFNLQDVIILEILFNLIKGIDVKKLWMTESQRTGQDLSDLKSLLTAEGGLSKEAKKNAWSRHGRFGTMIWVKREDEKMSAVSGQDNLRSGHDALFNMDKSKKWSKPQQRLKDSNHTIHDFNRSTYLSDSASEKLRNFVEEFLDSGFNPLFIHLRKAIEREADRLTDVNYRQFFYCVSWFLEAERVRREKNQNEVKPANLTNEFDFDSYSLVAGVLNQETFITLNRYMQVSLDNKEWQDLNACMRCFTQILLTVQEMAKSPLDEDQEIADNIQNRIFYEETTHDRIMNIVKGYKDQGFGYLDACTELAHVFLRVLERYSKENADLQIRSRRKARKRQKTKQKQAAAEAEKLKKVSNETGETQDAAIEEEAVDEESENEDIADAVQVSKERKFDFTRLVAKFSSEASVSTFVALTNFYRDLNQDQLKRAHRFFYRLAFKQDLAVLLYRVDIVALFYRMTQGPGSLDSKNPIFKEWQELSKQVFRKMFKKINQRPELIVELLFSKIGATLYYLEFGREKQTIAMTRAPAELEVKAAAGRDLAEQIGIVVTALVNDNKGELVKWVRKELEKAFDKRSAWELEAEALRPQEQNSTEEIENNSNNATNSEIQHTSITIIPDNQDTKVAMFKNARLKLLMRLVSFERTSDEDAIGAVWIIPGSINTTKLKEYEEIISRYETSPWRAEHGDDEISAEDQLRRVRNNNTSTNREGDEEYDENGVARRDAFIDDSEGDEEPEEFMFPDNIRSKTNKSRNILEELREKRRKRKRSDDDEEEVDDKVLAEKRKARKEAALERRRKIKSELYIRDSDDESDAEKNREFFEKEEQLRKKQDIKIRKQMALDIVAANEEKNADGKSKSRSDKGRKNKSVKPIIAEDEDEDLILDDVLGLDTDDSDGDDTVSSSSNTRKRSNLSGSDAEEDDDTPLSSQDNENDPGSDSDVDDLPSKKRKLTELRQARASRGEVGGSMKKKLDRNGDGSGEGKRRDGEDDTIMNDSEDQDTDVEEDTVVNRPQRRRAGFIIDSDDEE